MADLIHHLPRIVDTAVIIAELQHRRADRTIHERALRIPLCDQHTDVLFVEAVVEHPANESEGISRRLQIDRDRARLNERTIAHGLVIVSLIQHEISRREQRIHHHFIGAGCPVQYEIGLVCMKDLRRMLLRLERHPLMDQQMSHIYIRIAQVRTECILTIKIIKNTSAGVLSEILAALMARAVEFRISSLDILHQTFEERRQDPGLILLGCTFDLTLVVFLRSPGKIQNAIRLPQDVLTQLFPFLDNQKHGDAKGRKMRIPKDPAILLRDDDSSCFRQIAVFQTYTLPSFDLTYHAPGFITVRNFQSRLHPSILLSLIHIPPC